jgi:hypothetical protein
MSIASAQTIQPPFVVTVVIAPEPAGSGAVSAGSVSVPAKPPIALVPPARVEEEPTWEDAEWR